MSVVTLAIVAAFAAPVLYELLASKPCRFLLSKALRYGAPADPLRLLLLAIIVFYDRVFMRIEDLFLPWVAKVRIEKPLFIIGHMRSGTTNLHRSIMRSRADAASLDFIDVLAHSFTLRYPLLLAVHLYMTCTGAYARGDHRIRMYEPEEEDMALIHRYKGLLLLEVFSSRFLTHPDVYNDMHLPYDAADVVYLKRVMRRRLWASGKRQWIGKPITFVSSIELLRREFPDALFVLSIRHPCGTISSTLHMHRNKLNLENEFARSLSIYRCVCELLSSRDDRLIFVRFEDYVGDRPYWIRKILQRLDDSIDPEIPEDALLEPRETHQKGDSYVELAKQQLRDERQSWLPIFEQLGYKFVDSD